MRLARCRVPHLVEGSVERDDWSISEVVRSYFKPIESTRDAENRLSIIGLYLKIDFISNESPLVRNREFHVGPSDSILQELMISPASDDEAMASSG